VNLIRYADDFVITGELKNYWKENQTPREQFLKNEG